MDLKNKQGKMVSIREGNILEGQLDKDIYSKASKGIVHVTYNDYGSEATVNLLDISPEIQWNSSSSTMASQSASATWLPMSPRVFAWMRLFRSAKGS
jgi:hypothetical protein